MAACSTPKRSRTETDVDDDSDDDILSSSNLSPKPPDIHGELGKSCPHTSFAPSLTKCSHCGEEFCAHCLYIHADRLTHEAEEMAVKFQMRFDSALITVNALLTTFEAVSKEIDAAEKIVVGYYEKVFSELTAKRERSLAEISDFRKQHASTLSRIETAVGETKKAIRQQQKDNPILAQAVKRGMHRIAPVHALKIFKKTNDRNLKIAQLENLSCSFQSSGLAAVVDENLMAEAFAALDKALHFAISRPSQPEELSEPPNWNYVSPSSPSQAIDIGTAQIHLFSPKTPSLPPVVSRLSETTVQPSSIASTPVPTQEINQSSTASINSSAVARDTTPDSPPIMIKKSSNKGRAKKSARKRFLSGSESDLSMSSASSKRLVVANSSSFDSSYEIDLESNSSSNSKHFVSPSKAIRRTSVSSTNGSPSHLRLNRETERRLYSAIEQNNQITLTSFIDNNVRRASHCLALAIRKRSLTAVRFLLSSSHPQIDLPAPDSKRHRNSLHEAALSNNPDLLRLLLDHIRSRRLGAVLNSKDADGYTALHLAAESGYLDITRMLVDAGAGLEVRCNFGQTPLMEAADNGHLDIVKYLVSKGANIEAKDDESCQVIHIAALTCNLEVVKYLVSLNSDCVWWRTQINPARDIKNNAGDTPLSWAIASSVKDEKKRNETVAFLLSEMQKHSAKKASALALKSSSGGETPLTTATKRGYAIIVNLLHAAGAKK